MRRLPFTEPAQLALAESCLGRTQGLVVVSGPTSHGKTTTLYSCLGHLDRSRLNIRTLEDPVEFVVPWISQIPVGSGTGKDFGEACGACSGRPRTSSSSARSATGMA